jgi:L-methionine (R)-S-oxide reductase
MSKTDTYREAESRIAELVRDLEDPVAAMASTVAVLHDLLPVTSWAGFYRVVAPGLLRVGPYQGPVGCLEIAFDRGVCGAAARLERSQVVEDVHSFEGHIACDALARSEVVVPVFDSQQTLVAVLDLDSHEPAAFDDIDREALERIVRLLRPCFNGSNQI